MANEAGAEFWDWALKTYDKGRVSEICLELQDDHGQCVPLLLWAIWLGTKNLIVEVAMAETAANMARAWVEEVLIPVRGVRRRLKHSVRDMEDAPRLHVREQIKALELEVERQLMLGLAGLTGAAPDRSDTSHCLENAVVVARSWLTKVPRAALARLIDAIESQA